MTPTHTAVALALLAGAAAIQCPDASWFAFEDKCYSAQAPASTHAGCATICGGSNASLVHIESQDENDFVRFLADDNSWIGYYKVMSPKGDISLVLNSAGFQMPFDIHHAIVTMAMAPDRSGAVDGMIAGVLDTEEHITVLQQIAGTFDPALCSGTTFDSLAAQIRQASDILSDGTQDPTQTCNGISIGIGFTATAVQLSGITPAPTPPPDPCP